MTTGKTIALNRWTFVGKVMSRLFSMLFRLVMAFLPRSKNLLISWLHSPSAVILEPKKIKCFAIPFSSGPCFARTLHHDQSFMGGLTHHNFIELDKAVVHVAMAPHSTTLAWKIPWTEEPDRLQSMRSLRVRHSWMTSPSLFTFIHWRWKWQPTAVFLPGESQGRGSLVGCHLWGHTESGTTEVTYSRYFSLLLRHRTGLPWWAQMVKCLSTTRETRVQALGWEDPLEKEMAIHSSIIAWKIPWTEEPARLQSVGSQRVGHDWATSVCQVQKAKFTELGHCVYCKL